MKTNTRQRGGGRERCRGGPGQISLQQQQLQQQQQRQQQQLRDPYRHKGTELPEKQQQTRHPRTEIPHPGEFPADQ